MSPLDKTRCSKGRKRLTFQYIKIMKIINFMNAPINGMWMAHTLRRTRCDCWNLGTRRPHQHKTWAHATRITNRSKPVQVSWMGRAHQCHHMPTQINAHYLQNHLHKHFKINAPCHAHNN